LRRAPLRLAPRGCSVLLLAGLAVPPAALARSAPVVNDVTKINPIVVERVLTPTSIDEIVDAVRSHPGPVSIGGGRFSMGGQTATERTLQLDMRRFDKVVAFQKESKEITVQTGITWRKIQEYIDPYDLSLQIMQTYANFTVGGSLSVNVHGRYIGQGPLVHSVRSIRIVLADGTLAEASPTVNSDLFYGAIGGYGGLGVIVEATLALTDDVRVERRSVVMPLAAYPEYFREHVRDNADVVFHNADIYPNAFDTVRVTSYVKTAQPVTVPDRLMPKDKRYWLDRMAFRVMSEWPGGKAWRQHVLDPIVFRGERIEWRNYEASYDVKELEPVSRRASTYVLQEYFVPVDKLAPFVAKMAQILNRRRVNTINVSIRHARQDPGTLLAWARSEVFAFVLYYKQGTGEADRKAVGVWTRELIDAATGFGGAYYLPYQILATESQFRAAYPNADAFFALKKRIDPTDKFRNKLWDAYYEPGPRQAPGVPAPPTAPVRAPPPISPADAEVEKRIAVVLHGVEGYKRDEAQTYLTLPEWLLVYYPAEYASSLELRPPSAFPYFGAIGQFWSYYWKAYTMTRERYPFNGRYHLMVFVIGSSYTAENALKGIYESTIGRLTEWLASDARTQEDAFAAEVARDYVDFIRVDPWYEFSFARALKRLWAETEFFGPHIVRKWERKLILSAEYLVKAQYAMLIKLATKAAYGDADAEMLVRAENVAAGSLVGEAKVKVIKILEDESMLLSLPRYEEFRDVVLRLVANGARFREIAGNREILVTSVAPVAWRFELPSGHLVFEKTMLTDPQHKRVGIAAPVPSLHQILTQLADASLEVEHIYDY
jgi:FAD/FMN-containing dehydrogenase